MFTGFKRGKSTQYEQFALLKVKGVNEKKDAAFYFGKRVAYIYKGKSVRNNSKFRVIWGKIVKSHGNNGLVRAQFANYTTVSLADSQLTANWRNFTAAAALKVAKRLR